MMKKYLLLDLLLIICVLLNGQEAEKNKEWVTLKNEHQSLSFNLNNGLFHISDARGHKIVDYAYFQLGGLQSKEQMAKRTYVQSRINDELGEGQCLTIKVEFEDYADILWQAILYNDKDYIVFRMGVDNDTDRDYHLMAFYPLISNRVFEGTDNNDGYRILDGTGGGGKTQVSSRANLTSFNNVLFRFGKPESLNILVAGGLTYHEFEKFVTVKKQDKKFSVSLFSEDPTGKLVNPREKYLPDEKFYLCLNDSNQFEALEKYGQTLKKAQNIKLNMYDFPTECLWYASFYNNEKGRRKFNDTQGACEEMDNAIASGITKYTRVSIRLVPDAYGADNQQGWWDDKHWGMYGDKMSTDGPHYAASLPTTKSWAENISGKGGVPITYFQSGRRSDDFAKAYPDYMLFNDKYRVINQPERFLHRVEHSAEYGNEGGYYNHWWADKMLWSYDFTDPGFTGHMKNVYKNLKEAGIQGIMYDYPEVTAWAFEGGFEDKYATTAHAYRNMFQLAYDGLGSDCYLDERNLLRGSDLTLGLVASQRVWADTDGITPEMVARCGLRWYKNRIVVNYDMDAKDPSDALPFEHSDGNRSMLTMCYVTSGRFLLGRSFKQLTKEQLYDLSRTFPYHTTAQSARPLDAFNEGVTFPRIYDFKVNQDWHQITFYNYNMDAGKPELNRIEVALGEPENNGGLALDPTQKYYVYDFWNDHFCGQFNGADKLKATLRNGEARMMSIHRKQNVPQFISTNRHIMQGYLDMKTCGWNNQKNELAGESEMVGGEPYIIVIATNGKQPVSCRVEGGKASFQAIGQDGVIKLSLSCKQSGKHKWNIKFK